MLGEKVVVFFGGKGRLDIFFGAHSLVGTQLVSVVEKLAAKFARHGRQQASANEKAISIVSFVLSNCFCIPRECKKSGHWKFKTDAVGKSYTPSYDHIACYTTYTNRSYS